MFFIFFVLGYVYYLQQSNFYIRTEIKPVNQTIYESIEGKEYVDDPEIEHFRLLVFTFKLKYPKQVENIKIEMPLTFRQILTSSIYWTGESGEFNDLKRRVFMYEEEVILYTATVSNEELVDLLSKGRFIVTWTENGEEKVEEFLIEETIEFGLFVK